MECTEHTLITRAWTFHHSLSDHACFDHLSRETCAKHSSARRANVFEFLTFCGFYTYNWYCIFSFPEHSVGSGAAAEADCVPYTLHPLWVEGESSDQGGRMEGVNNKGLYGEAPPRGLTPYRYHFRQNLYPFRISFTEKWYPFHMLSLEHCFLLTAVNVLSFKNG